MASFTKFYQFATDLSTKVHNLNADSLKCALSNSAPTASTGATISDITQIANGNGYSTGGSAASNSGGASGGTYTITGTNITWTSSGAGMATFRYIVLYNDTPTSPADPLIGYWDYASGVTLAVGDTFTIQFNGGVSTGTILTVA